MSDKQAVLDALQAVDDPELEISIVEICFRLKLRNSLLFLKKLLRYLEELTPMAERLNLLKLGN